MGYSWPRPGATGFPWSPWRGDSPARRFYDRRLSQPAGGPSLSGGRGGSPPGPVGPGPAGRGPKAARCWSVPAGKPSGRRRPWRPAKVPAPRRRKHCFAARTTRRRPSDPGRGTASLRGTWGHSLRCLPAAHQLRTAEADQARQDGLLRDTVQQTQALEKEIAQREAKVETLEAARRALSVQLEQSTGQKLALERARVENGPGGRPRMTCSCGCSERPGCWSRESCRPAWRKNASWTGCGTPMA